MPPSKFSDEELELLTPEERAAMTDDSFIDEGEDTSSDTESDEDDDSDEEAEKAKKSASEDDEEAESDENDEDDEAAADEDGDDEDEDAGKKSDDEDDEGAEEDADGDGEGAEAASGEDDDEDGGQEEEDPYAKEAQEFAPQRGMLNWTAPENAENRLKEIETERSDLVQKFDDGEIDRDEYQKQTRELETERDDLKNSVNRAKIAVDMAAADWEGYTVPKFLAKYSQYKPGTVLIQMLDARVSQIQQNNDYGNPFDPRILLAAHNQIQTELAEAMGTPKPKPSKTDKDTSDGKESGKTKAGKKSKSEKRPEMPKTLADVPADEVETTEGEFAHIDRLEGEAYENALMKMPDEMRERYLRTR